MTRLQRIENAATGESWKHERTDVGTHGFTVTVVNEKTHARVMVQARYLKFALLDALIATGCPRRIATEAVRDLPAW